VGPVPDGGLSYHYELRTLLDQSQRRIARAAGGLMSDRLEFDTVCPNNHNQTVTFSQEEFEEALKSGELVFHCNTCDTNWPPSSEEIAKLRKQFSKNSA
jgi:hypothetical protein